MEPRAMTEPSLDDVFWARVGLGHKDIDCRSFVALCKESNLVDDTLKDHTAEMVFRQSMPLSRRRLDFVRLQDALRRVAEIRNEDELAVHRKVIEAYARNRPPYLKRTGSLPSIGSRTDSPKNDGQVRHRSASGAKRHKHRSKKGEDKDKSVQLPSASSTTPEPRRPSALLCASASPAYNMPLPISPAGQSQMPTTPGEASLCPSTPVDVGGVLPTPSSVTSAAFMSIPNTPTCDYQSFPATPANETQEMEPPLSCTTLQLPSCNPASVMLNHSLRPPEEETQAAPSSQTDWELAPGESACASTGEAPCNAQQLPPVPISQELGEAAPPPYEQPGSGQQPSSSGSTSARSPPVPRLPLGICTDDLDMPSLLSSRQPSHGTPIGAKTLKRSVRSGKGLTRVVSLPAPIDTGSDMAQLVSEAGAGLNSPLRSPGRPSSGLFRRESPNASSGSGKLDDFHMEKNKGTVEDTFKAFCGEHADMDSKSFVKLCKKSGLLDQKFTAHDARLVFSAAVPISHVRMDLHSFESALAHVAAKRGLEKGLVINMVSFFEPSNGAQITPTSPTLDNMPMGLPDSPLAKAGQRPSSASRSRAALDSTERPSPTSMSRQASLPNVVRRQESAAHGHANIDCLPSPGRSRSKTDDANPLDDCATLQAPMPDNPSKFDGPGKPSFALARGGKESVGSRDVTSPHSAPLMPLQATLPIQTQVMMPHMMVGVF